MVWSVNITVDSFNCNILHILHVIVIYADILHLHIGNFQLDDEYLKSKTKLQRDGLCAR